MAPDVKIIGAEGAVISIVIVTEEDASETLPDSSVAVAVMM